jgi:UDP-2,3-diacylglucosamine pyrophosphatase LpxH
MIKRELDIAVISDVHLGTFGCHSSELQQYLNSIRPKILILNGDIIDAFQFQQGLMSNEHLEIIRCVLKMAVQGTKVYYLSGNHDDIIRGYSAIVDENIVLRNHLELVIDQKKYWIFHGDIFDASVIISPAIAKIGLWSYRYLIMLNRIISKLRFSLGMSRLSLAQHVKRRIGRALKYIDNFENIISRHALKNEYDAVICGHIHVPVIKSMFGGRVTYMNSGDWVENLTALEYQYQKWKIFYYDPADFPPVSKRLQVSSGEKEEPKGRKHILKSRQMPKEKKMPGRIAM